MTGSHFNTLTHKEKGVVYVNEGTHLENRIVYGECTIVIYAVYNFYVEVKVDLKTKKITEIKALESMEDFDGIMDSIKLDDLIG